MKKIPSFLLSLLSGLLLFSAWPVSPLVFLAFIAFIALLWLERQGIRRGPFLGWVYIAMLTWNVAATWWVWNATGPGAIAAFMANSLLMCLPWLGFYNIKRRMGDTVGYASLVAFWLSFEYLHLQNWGLSWPWLTVGNVFASHPAWVQWYEFTGTSGGSLWVLIVNILLFRLAWDRRSKLPLHKPTAWWLIGILVIPATASLLLRPARTMSANPAAVTSATSGSKNPTLAPPATAGAKNSTRTPASTLAGKTADTTAAGKNPAGTTPGNIVIVQPNVDPYGKIMTGSFDVQLQRLIRLSDSAIDDSTVLVVWPETALYNEQGFEEDHLRENYFLTPLWAFLRRHPHINLLTGIEGFRVFDSKHSPTAMKIPNSDKYFETYNEAALMDSSGPIAFYHKSRLVPGAETLPPFLRFLLPWFEKFGATEGGYTGQDDRSVLYTTNHSYAIATAVCYESIYGEFMSRYVHNGADLIAVITNDGWWGNTPGYHQHENYARLRAIENRRWVVRSANTGVSCIIDPAGRIIDSRPWATTAVIRGSVPAREELTFYARYGDCVSKIALLLTLLILAGDLVTIIKSRKHRPTRKSRRT